jgi:hypothetical protein
MHKIATLGTFLKSYLIIKTLQIIRSHHILYNIICTFTFPYCLYTKPGDDPRVGSKYVGYKLQLNRGWA